MAAAIDPLARLSPGIKAKCASLGLHSLRDFLFHLPIRYEDETAFTPWDEIEYGKTVHIEVEVIGHEISYAPRKSLKVKVRGGPLQFQLRFLHFYPNQAQQFKAGVRVRLLGECRPGFQCAEFVHPRYGIVNSDSPLPTELTPIYSTTAGLSQATLRKWIDRALQSPEAQLDSLPKDLLSTLKLPEMPAVLAFLHHPPRGSSLSSLEDRQSAPWRRLKFDELLAQQLSMQRFRRLRQSIEAPAIRVSGSLQSALRQHLPFALTGAQKRVIEEITGDLGQAHPMQRLLQGDVGSGKTVVAAVAALQAIEAGHQAALIAPTEILATQHFSKIESWLTPLGIRCQWLTGQQKKSQREEALQAIAQGHAQLVIGTHALFEEAVLFNNLGLVIIDEQHRFGVEQRLALKKKCESKGWPEPHQLMMSATPIPRTLCMSFYADLDVSVIDELPPGRTPVQTRLVDAVRRQALFAQVRSIVERGQQVYWVCPLIEESEVLDLQTAIDTAAELTSALPECKVGLVHGRLSAHDKTTVMNGFQENAIQILVATTVIEVGVDVPNATLMVIEHAERMGLAQLHQLRGRVGRGREAAWCVLLYYAPLSETAKARLKVIYENTDGFAIAREDLRIRGPGEFLGARQSGVPLLRFADLNTDADLVEQARDFAAYLLNHAPQLAEAHLESWLGARAEYLRA